MVDFHKETTFLGIEQSHGCSEPRLKRGRSVAKVAARISISPEVYRPISIARGDNIDLFRLDRARPRTASIPVLRSCERLSMNQRRAFAGFVFILSGSSSAHEQTRRLRAVRHGFTKVQLRRRNYSLDPRWIFFPLELSGDDVDPSMRLAATISGLASHVDLYYVVSICRSL